MVLRSAGPAIRRLSDLRVRAATNREVETQLAGPAEDVLEPPQARISSALIMRSGSGSNGRNAVERSAFGRVWPASARDLCPKARVRGPPTWRPVIRLDESTSLR